MKFNHVVCGGTFDHFHNGHKKLLEACLLQGKKVTVGVTIKAMTRHKSFAHSIESYRERVKSVTNFNTSFTLFKLTDMYGPTLSDSSIDALFVTRDTFVGAELINKRRKEIGMKPLSIIVIPFALDDEGEKISSEAIRQGIITREGVSYYRYLISRDTYYLPESLKGALRKPLGRVISSLEKHKYCILQKTEGKNSNESRRMLISVGDVVTYNIKKTGITSFLSLIDGKTRRKALNKPYIEFILEKEHYNAPNKKGTIQREAIQRVYDLYTLGQKRATNQLFITGEEDLLTLVAVLFAPLGAHVFYGQSGRGAIDVRVTEKKKQTVYNLVKQFE